MGECLGFERGAVGAPVELGTQSLSRPGLLVFPFAFVSSLASLTVFIVEIRHSSTKKCNLLLSQ
ncbi:MAG TPA: hypothetical protein DCE44_06600 [Verrucomicrobiales bacterium]|nr:hypothetical protein [Verrucomicrobiales bacterium]